METTQHDCWLPVHCISFFTFIISVFRNMFSWNHCHNMNIWSILLFSVFCGWEGCSVFFFWGGGCFVFIPPRFNAVEYTGFTLSVCPSVDRIVSALYLQQYSLDPFHICTSYQATSEVGGGGYPQNAGVLVFLVSLQFLHVEVHIFIGQLQHVFFIQIVQTIWKPYTFNGNTSTGLFWGLLHPQGSERCKSVYV